MLYWLLVYTPPLYASSLTLTLTLALTPTLALALTLTLTLTLTLHQAQSDGEGKPEPLRCLTHCCLRCCLDGAARLLQYLSHNAYVLVAVHDLSFCQGAKMAFELTMANIGQVANPNR